MVEKPPALDPPLDLTNCDREQIQFAAATLAHGFLVVLREPELVVIQAGENTPEFLGASLDEILGQPVETWLGSDFSRSLREHIAKLVADSAPFHVGIAPLRDRHFDVFLHRSSGSLILEFERRAGVNGRSLDQNLFSTIHATVARLQQTQSLQQFLDLAVTQVREFTGFDRVMAYEFLEDGSGAVRAESVAEGWEPFLNLHYPASDIPLPARRLFKLTWLRHQPDIGYTPVPIVPAIIPETQKPLDLSFALLRSVSVMYSQYLKNMGVQSSMVMTLLKEGELWGLIACHHHSAPRHVPFEIRAVCQFLAQMTSLLLASKKDHEDYEYGVRLEATHSHLTGELALNTDLLDVLTGRPHSILSFIQSDGAAVVLDGVVTLMGLTPEPGQVNVLVHWLGGREENVFHTDGLVTLHPEALSYCEVASGVVAIRITAKNFILWFRSEFRRTVNWAGDPHKPVDLSNDGQRLIPRTSFALWKETVRHRSKPWKAVELEAASNLRGALMEVSARKAENLTLLYKDLQQNNVESAAEVKDSREQLRLALKASRMGIWTWNVTRDAVEFSEDLALLFGHPVGRLSLPLNLFLQHVHPSDLPGITAQLRAASEQPASFSGEFRIAGPHGEPEWIELHVSSSPVEHTFRVIGTARDVTAKKLMEQRAIAAEKLESMGVMAGGLAHDFNNLLVSIIGSASLVQDILPAIHSAQDLLSEVVKAGERAAVLTSQMLAYSGKGQFLNEHVNISHEGWEAIEAVKSKVRPGIEIRTNFEPGVLTAGDPLQIRQAMVNLLTNAIEAIGPGLGSIRLSTRMQDVDQSHIDKVLRNRDIGPGRFVSIEVQDNGCGIAEIIKDRIFEPFFSTKFTGRGLGLAAVDGIVRAHKGVIQVASRAGGGTTVTLLFPALAIKDTNRVTLFRSVTRIGLHTILVVDDEEIVSKVAASYLRKWGFRVIVTNSGEAALNLIANGEEKISAVLLDLTMPEMSGREVLRRLRELDANLPVILSSGYSEDSALSQIEGEEIAGFLQKPYNESQLVAKVQVLQL